MRFNRIFSIACALAGTFSTVSAQNVSSFADIDLWYGTGENQAGLVIDWNDGSTTDTFAWGFRWSGTATGEDMFRTIAGQIANAVSPEVPGPAIPDGMGDINLSLYILSFNFDDVFVDAVDRITFNDQFGESHNQNSNGFTTGSWAYWTAEGNGTYPADWQSASTGFSGRTLSNGSWDGWTFFDGPFNDFPGPQPDAATAAVPEPSVLMLLGLGLVFVLYFRRRTLPS